MAIPPIGKAQTCLIDLIVHEGLTMAQTVPQIVVMGLDPAAGQRVLKRADPADVFRCIGIDIAFIVHPLERAFVGERIPMGKEVLRQHFIRVLLRGDIKLADNRQRLACTC